MPTIEIDSGEIVAEGQRVELHPATDVWMRGDRYGVIEHIMRGSEYARVRFDRSGYSRRMHARDIGKTI